VLVKIEPRLRPALDLDLTLAGEVQRLAETLRHLFRHGDAQQRRIMMQQHGPIALAQRTYSGIRHRHR